MYAVPMRYHLGRLCFVPSFCWFLYVCWTLNWLILRLVVFWETGFFIFFLNPFLIHIYSNTIFVYMVNNESLTVTFRWNPPYHYWAKMLNLRGVVIIKFNYWGNINNWRGISDPCDESALKFKWLLSDVSL